MNNNQRIVAVIVGVFLLGMLLFPPFHFISPRGTLNQGYSLIFNPPLSGMATINTVQLLIQILVVGVVGGIAWFFCKERP